MAAKESLMFRLVSRFRAAGLAIVAIAAASASSAATATLLVPTAAPRGARAVLVGTGLDAGTINVTFAAAAGRTPAAVISRTATVIEIGVPANAASGTVQVD